MNNINYTLASGIVNPSLSRDGQLAHNEAGFNFNKMEIWKDIKGYEGYYMVSNLGRVVSLRQDKVMKGGISKEYRMMGLRVNNHYKTFTVHRLVLKTFTPNIK